MLYGELGVIDCFVKLMDRVVEQVVSFGAFGGAVSQKVIVLFAGFVRLLNLEALLLSCGEPGELHLLRGSRWRGRVPSCPLRSEYYSELPRLHVGNHKKTEETLLVQSTCHT